jgi:hypothetical protein
MMVAWADGSVTFIASTIDPLTYWAVLTPDGHEDAGRRPPE